MTFVSWDDIGFVTTMAILGGIERIGSKTCRMRVHDCSMSEICAGKVERASDRLCRLGGEGLGWVGEPRSERMRCQAHAATKI